MSNESVKNGVVAGIILNRDFDIPDIIFDMVNDKVLTGFFHQYQDVEDLLKRYQDDKIVKKFFDTIRNKGVISDLDKFISNFLHHRNWNKLFPLIFTKSNWKKYLKRYPFDMIHYISLISDIEGLEDIFELLVKSYRDRFNTIEDMIFEICRTEKNNISIETLVKICYILKANENLEDTMILLKHGIPILYKEFMPEMLFWYIQTVLEVEYRGELDTLTPLQIVEYRDYEYSDIEKLTSLLKEIGCTLNQNNLKYYYFTKEKGTDKVSEVIQNLAGGTKFNGSYNYKLKPNGYLKDFKDLIIMLGNNPSGYPLPIQMLFLRHGDIKTMFNYDGSLMSEANILKSPDQLTVLLRNLSIHQLNFLLFNSSDFVQNLIVENGKLNVNDYLNIARAFLTLPVDEELWKALNTNEYKTPLDYRSILINKLVNVLGVETLFNNVPEAMAYIEPSVLYIVKSLKMENIQYAPIHRITPYLKRHIASNPYTRYNLYEDGKFISIIDAVSDAQFIFDIIVKGKKFGYICDLDIKDIPKAIDLTVDLIMSREMG